MRFKGVVSVWIKSGERRERKRLERSCLRIRLATAAKACHARWRH